MANYTVTSDLSDLNGTLVMTADNIESYTNAAGAAGTVNPVVQPTTGLVFNVRFPNVQGSFNVNARPNGNGFIGTANNGRPEAGEESWSATASTGAAAAS